MNNQKGFTLVEILITMVLVSAIIGMAYYAYNRLATGITTESSSIQGAMDKIIGLELLRLDIEHAGFGISKEESCSPVRWIAALNSSDQCDPDIEKGLILRSTLNNSNQKTLGWILVDCKQDESWLNHIIVDERKQPTNNVVFLDYRKHFAFSGNVTSKCPLDAHYIGYPVDTSVSSGCNVQTCTRIAYVLSSSQSLAQCAQGTRNLLRKVGGELGAPILNCVADWELRFGLDTDNDGAVDSVVLGTDLPSSPEEIRNQLKYISFYALVQEGNFDSTYDYGNNVTVDNDVVLTFPSDCPTCPNYHWKVIKKTIRLMDL